MAFNSLHHYGQKQIDLSCFEPCPEINSSHSSDLESEVPRIFHISLDDQFPIDCQVLEPWVRDDWRCLAHVYIPERNIREE
jgi:hypothetical protein